MWPLSTPAVFYLAFNGILVLLFGWLGKETRLFPRLRRSRNAYS